MSSPTGSDQNYPQGGAPQGGQPGWSAPPPGASPQGYNAPDYNAPDYNAPDYNAPDYNAPGYNAPGYNPAPSYAGGPPATGQRPGMVTAAAIVGIVWGGLGLLFGLLALSIAFAVGAFYGLILLIGVVVSAALLWAGIQVLQGKSPKLLLLICYVAIGINLLSLIIGLAMSGGNAFSGILGFIIPGVIVALLLNPQSKQYYASRGIAY